ncbi:hypothetical protein OROMI_017371 [Orobanche minor]
MIWAARRLDGLIMTVSSQSVNVSTTSSSGTREFVNAGQIGGSSSLRDTLRELIPITIISFILQIAIFYDFAVL